MEINIYFEGVFYPESSIKSFSHKQKKILGMVVSNYIELELVNGDTIQKNYPYSENCYIRIRQTEGLYRESKRDISECKIQFNQLQ